VNLVKPHSGELVGIVQRIIAGDSEAEAEVVRRYTRGVSVIIERIIRSQTASDDVSQDTFKIVLEKIRRGDVRQPERLSGFVCSVAKNAAIDYVRRARQATKREESGDADHIADSAPSPLDVILKQEQTRVVRQIISELKIDRDRDLLFRYYIAEEDKEKICAELHMTRAQFNNVISRATARFKELYVQRIGRPER
jgi:RNA polymerase sigma-70 factor, ECF subfamily